MKDFEIVGDTLVRYRGKEKHVVIPDGVTKIGERAFSSDYWTYYGIEYANAEEYAKENPQFATFLEDLTFIESVVIPEGVTTIGRCAFDWCDNLKSVTIPKSVTDIREGAFDLKPYMGGRPLDVRITATIDQVIKILKSSNFFELYFPYYARKYYDL